MKILVKTIAGSHLFGTNSEKSDKDFKGIYLPMIQDCITGNVKHTIRTTTNTLTGIRNSSEDIDSEFYSLQKFLKLVEEGQTVALELLFTPESHILEKSQEWDYIISQRDKLLHSGIKSFIGYARQQSDRYGLMGSKMQEIDKMIDILYKFNPKTKIKDNREEILYLMPINHCKFITNQIKGQEYEYLVINGKLFDIRTSIEDVLNRLIKTSQAYGTRARDASENNAFDAKAVSHALRVCYQGIELLTEHKITLPLKAEVKNEVLKCKSGNMPFNEANVKIIELFNKLNQAYTNTSLPNKVETEYILFEIYGNIYNIK